jgi:carbon storage regulator
MLVLTRRIGEAVHIGDDIVVRVLGVKGNQVRLGFDVPKSINVVRDELLKKTPEPVKEV